MRASGLASRPALAAWLALLAGHADRARRLCRLHRSGRSGSRSPARGCCRAPTSSACASTSACSPTSAGWSRSATSPSSACCSSLGSLVLGFLLAVFIDQRIRAEDTVPHHLPLSRSRCPSSSPASSGSGSSTRASASQKLVRDLGFDELHLRLDRAPGHGDLHLVIAGALAGSGLVMAIMLAGLRGIDEESGRPPASTASRPGGSISRSSCRCCGRCSSPRPCCSRPAWCKLYDLVGRDDQRRPGHRLRGAGQVRHGPPVRAQQSRPRHRRRDRRC